MAALRLWGDARSAPAGAPSFILKWRAGEDEDENSMPEMTVLGAFL